MWVINCVHQRFVSGDSLTHTVIHTHKHLFLSARRTLHLLVWIPWWATLLWTITYKWLNQGLNFTRPTRTVYFRTSGSGRWIPTMCMNCVNWTVLQKHFDTHVIVFPLCMSAVFFGLSSPWLNIHFLTSSRTCWVLSNQPARRWSEKQ